MQNSFICKNSSKKYRDMRAAGWRLRWVLSGPPYQSLLMSALWGVGVVGMGHQCLPPATPNTDQSLVLAGPGQEGRMRPGQRLQSQQLRTLHLGEQPVVDMGKREKHRKLGWAGRQAS